MIGCLNDEKCTYPRCPRTCGLDEPGIIAMLQEQIEVLRTYRRNMNLGLLEIRHLEERLDNLQREGYKDSFNYYDECPFDDCIHHPMDMKQYRPEYWQKQGCPTRCFYFANPKYAEDSLGTYACPYYDDECK